MAKSADEQKRVDVESAIRSLYDMFPDVNSCRRSKTRKAMGIQAKIDARKAELAKDAKLVALEKQLHDERQQTVVLVKQKRREIDALLRRFRLRGAEPNLLTAVEKMSNETPVVFFDEDCF
ncbi:MAG: hypothetical protein U0791_26695 [Gemmataceae bacterium]